MRALFLMLFLAAPAFAGSFSDVVMAPGVLEGVGAGRVLEYSHTRHLPAHAPDTTLPGAANGILPPAAVDEGRVMLTAEPGAQGLRLVLSRTENGQPRPGAEFPAKGPNPVLLFFLENTVRVMAAETGGSPFYIRNRIRAALGQADLPVTEGVVVLRPFAEDPSRARMGDFAGLSLSLRVDPADPGRLLELKADTAAGEGGYTERMVVIPEE